MVNLTMPQALRYQPAFEQPEDDESRTTEELARVLTGISATVFDDSGHARRSVHAKGHGLLRGELRVLESLPDVLAQGLCARPATYPVVMRLSTSPGDLLDDKVSTPRGLALKLLGVDGARLPGSEAESTQDFLMVNSPTFLAPDARHFLRSVKLLAATTDKAPELKKLLSAALRGAESLIEAAGGASATLKALGGHRLTHILGESFFSQVPMLWGDAMVKVSVAPISSELLALKDAPLDLDGRPDGLRDAVSAFFAEAHGAEWELRVQLCTDLETMPIEDASVTWPEAQSPYIAVARIRALPQQTWSESGSTAVEDALSFSPWHGLAAHRPLGSIMRVRRAVYQASARFRAERNGVPTGEPAAVGCPAVGCPIVRR